jgi:hypothetical protein
MHPKTYKLLRWLLIVMLTITPLRAVTADVSGCKMNAVDNVHTVVMMSAHATGHHHVGQHDQATKADGNSTVSHQCCCCDDSPSACAGNCDMGVSASLILQELSYAVAVLAVSESVITTSSILLRELTPPSRPPAAIS